MSRSGAVHLFFLSVICLIVFVHESKCKEDKPVKMRALPKRHELSSSEDDYKLLNFSGVLPINETTKKLVAGGIENETACLFERIKHLVESSNSSMEQVESIIFYMADLSWNYIVNDYLKKYFVYPYPGTTLWEQGYILPMNASISAEVIARIPIPSRGFQKDILRGRDLDRMNSEYEYQLHEIPGRAP